MFMIGVMISGASKSDPMSITPFVGAVTEYASNPYLVANSHSVSDVAILLNAPVAYDMDSAHFGLIPKIRYSDNGTYASLSSNSLHLDGNAQFSSDVGSLTLTAGLGRDSSFYYNGLASNGVGVRTDSTSTGASWQRLITPRLTLQLDAGWQRVNYGQSGIATGLQDYRNTSAAPSLQFAVSERDTLTLQSGAGLYKTIDGVTESKSLDLQLGIDHRLTEIWTLSTTAGYSKANNAFNLFYGPYLLEKIESRQNGPIYKAGLMRKGELFNFSAGASRAFVPSGFAFLSRQDTASIAVHYTYSERWAFEASDTYQRTQDPTATGGYSERSYFSGEASALWNWTPNWTITLRATKVNANYETLRVGVASSGISLEISRQFLRIDL
jgi:hypothetical protein